MIKLLLFVCLVSCEACVYYKTGVLSSQKTLIVDKHNSLRCQICNGNVTGQPAGVNIKQLIWDSTLAAAAQSISNSCVFAHQSVSDDRWYVGQNLYSSWSTSTKLSADWTTAIEKWFSEYSSYVYGQSSFSGAGHYTQVIWANTAYVGCGYTCYKSSSNDTGYKKLYVCNYGPGGNIVGELPYKSGDGGCDSCS